MASRLRFVRFALAVLLVVPLATWSSALAAPSGTHVTARPWGETPSGEAVQLFTLSRAGAPEVAITNFGGFIVSIQAKDREGRAAEMLLGYRDFDGYLHDGSAFGCLVGRYANRIGGASFTLDGTKYTLVANAGRNSLHGGPTGFCHRVWTPKLVEGPDGQALELSYTSRAGEEGFPGTLTATVVYSLRADGGLVLDYRASTDAATVVNLTNHAYFNLKGEGEGSVLEHELEIEADQFTPTDATLVPTGELRAVAGTPLDFRTPVAIGARIEADDELIKIGRGYDHNFVVRGRPGELRLAARVTEKASGRVLEVLTTQPGVQLYTANHLDGKPGRSGKPYVRRGAFCLETQHYPDSPNRPEFPTTVLRPGETFHEVTVYRFGVLK